MNKRVLCIDDKPRPSTCKGEKLPEAGREYNVTAEKSGICPITWASIVCYAIPELNRPNRFLTEKDRFIDAEDESDTVEEVKEQLQTA